MAKKKPQFPKRKITKEERRVKYTAKAKARRTKKNHVDKVCFNCRRKGHTAAECPNINKDADGSMTTATKLRSQICYKCGTFEHTLKQCPKLTSNEKKVGNSGRLDYFSMILPFATCFICKKKGHLSSQCEQNENGLYVKGGSCKVCGSKTHLVADCPVKLKKEEDGDGDGDGDGDESSTGDVAEFLEEDEGTSATPYATEMDKIVKKAKRKKKVVNF